jgi:hypothetical protein
MTKQAFQNSIYNELLELGYKPVLYSNKEPYSGKDMFFCPQAPNLFLLYITPGATRIEKIGKRGYMALTTTQVKGPNDIAILHQEINSIIYQSNESTLKEKSTGCFGFVLFIIMAILIIIIS